MVVASVMASCSNGSNDMVKELDPANKPSASQSSSSSSSNVVNTTFDGNIYFFAAPSQFNYVNTEYTVQVGSQTMTVDVATLPTTTNYPLVVELDLKQSKSTFGEGYVTPNVYVFKVPTNLKGDIQITSNFSLKEGANLPKDFFFCYGAESSDSKGSGIHANQVITSNFDKFNSKTRTVYSSVLK